MATHDHAIVDAMRRRVIQLDRGEVVRDQTRGVYRRLEAEEQETPDQTPEEPEAKVEVEIAETEDSSPDMPGRDDPAPTAEFEVWSESQTSPEA